MLHVVVFLVTVASMSNSISTSLQPASTSQSLSSSLLTTTPSLATNATREPPVLAEASTTSNVPSSTPKPRKCGNAEDTEYCYYENSTEICDICVGVTCPNGKKCVKKEQVCAPSCVCANDVDIETENGTCRNPCELYKCQNNGVCVPDVNRPSKFRCICGEEFEGELCEEYHNFCTDNQPLFCPIGQYKCIMNGFRNYTCECPEGFFYNVTGRNCVKVGQRVKITLYFKDTLYSEIFNIRSSKEAVSARKVILSAFEKIYGGHLIKLIFDDFTQGSLVAHLQLMLKLDNTGAFRANERVFKQFLLDCDTKNIPCFGSLGKAYLPFDGWAATDERCGNIICPENTVCEPIEGSLGKTQCVCKDGFKRIGAVVDEQDRLIQICEDINECDLNPCETIEECLNLPGSYQCGGIPNNATCPKGSLIVVTGPFSYRCECSWIYGGTNCRFPLTLLLLILVCIFVLTTIGAVMFAFLRTRRNRTGT